MDAALAGRRFVYLGTVPSFTISFERIENEHISLKEDVTTKDSCSRLTGLSEGLRRSSIIVLIGFSVL